MKKNIAEGIKEQIHAHKISMRPKSYFIVSAALLGIGLAASVLVAMFFIGVTIFRLRVNAPFSYLQSPHGVSAALDNLPLIPILVACMGIIGGLLLMRKFEFSYKHAFYGIAGGFLITVGAVGIILDVTGLPEQAEQLNVLGPLLHSNYENDSWVAGTILSIDDNILEIETPHGVSYNVVITGETDIIPPTILITNEWIRVLGERDDDTFIAEQIIHQPSPLRTPRIQGRGPLMPVLLPQG